MSGSESVFEQAPRREADDRVRRTRRHEFRPARGNRLRRAFFALSALGGYVIGNATIGIALAAHGQHVPAENPLVLGTLAAGGVVAAGVGVILAASYRELRNRRR